MFELPQVVRPIRRIWHGREPLIDYSKLIILASEDYILVMEAKIARLIVVVREHEEFKNLIEQKDVQQE